MSRPTTELMVEAASLQIAGKTEQALAALRRSEEAGEESSDLLSAIGRLEFELGNFEAAAEAYAELSRREPEHPTADFNLGVSYERLEKWELAAAFFQKAIDTEPRRAGAQLGLGVALLHLNRPQDALDVFNACLVRQPFRQEALEGKAVALESLLPERLAGQAGVENIQRVPGLVQVKQRNSEPKLRAGAPRLDIDRLLKRGGSQLPLLEPLVTDAQIEIRRRVLRLPPR